MNFKPLFDRVLVRADERETMTASGIVIPDAVGEKPSTGVICAVGPGRQREDGSLVEMSLAVGDKVLYGKYGGQDVKVNGVQYTLLKESDVYGVFPG